MKTEVSKKITALAAIADISPRSKIYSQIYNDMQHNYYVPLDEYTKIYKTELNTTSAATIDVIEHYTELQQQFNIILGEYIEQYVALIKGYV